MAKQFNLPDLGEGLHEAEISELLVSVGDNVEEGDQIMIVETDKASVEIPSPYTGVVSQIHVEPGDIVEVGEPLMSFDGAGEEKIQPKAEEKEVQEAADKKEKRAEPEKKQETEKVRAEEQPQAQAEAVERTGPVPASPSTRRLARELIVDIAQVRGSGPGGRVTEQDVRSFAEKGAPSAAGAPEKEAGKKKPARPKGERALTGLPSLISEEDIALPDFSTWGETERIPLRSIRRAVAKKMAASWSQIPHVSHNDVADITALMELRNRFKEEVEGGLTLTAFAVKAVVAALKEHPRFNASLDTETEEIIIKHYYNIGVAVDTERGLIVPVILDADRKSISEISAELADLVNRTRNDENTLQDIQGGTFTITNAGVLGGTHFSPIINHPQVAILGMARAGWQPVVQKGEHGRMDMVPRLLLPLNITFDHRVLDGGDGARFMNSIISMLENAERFLLKV